MKDFKDFIAEHGPELKSEFLLPLVVDNLIKSNIKKVKFLFAEDKWYGVTYKEDKQVVVDALADLISKGAYANL